MLFITAFFAINIVEFPKNDNGGLPLQYVSKYMCKQRYASQVSGFIAYSLNSWDFSSSFGADNITSLEG
jgi:hypothetical protein